MTKKKSKPSQPAKPVFTTAPFAALRGLTVAHTPKTRPDTTPQAALPPSPETESDLLFRQAMAGVRPINQEQATPKKAARSDQPARSAKTGHKPASALPRDEVIGRKTFLQALDRLKLDVRFEDHLPEDDELRPLTGNRLRQVKRGIIRLDRQLDLHGLTREEALEALPPFLTAARQAGEKGVLVITGQGRHSAQGPVLHQAVTSWLRDQGRELVLEFAPAPRELGGAGALVIFVRPLDKPVKG